MVSITNLEVFKRNKPTCNRLGNIYDACQWMLRFKINNKTKYNLLSFCSVIKVDKKKYQMCLNKKKSEFHTAANDNTTVLTNLSKLINYNNDLPKPKVTIISLKGKFSKP